MMRIEISNLSDEQIAYAEAHPLPEYGGKREQGAHNTLMRGSTNADYLARRMARDR
jgi:hypothetical protein